MKGLARATVAVLLATAVLTPWAVTSAASSRNSSCTVGAAGSRGQQAADSSTTTFDATQIANARIVTSVGRQLRLPVRANVIALATALQESGLRNLPGGDLDSAGLFQQRPSASWGTYAQVTDPVFASASFFDRLMRVPGWQRLPLTDAAQAVQRSAFPDAYARWEQPATALTRALGAGTPSLAGCMELSSDPEGPSSTGEAMGPDGLTASTRGLRQLVIANFAVHDIGGYCPGGCTAGHVSNSDHYTGHAIDVMLTPMDSRHHQLGNAIAAWAVANAGPLHIKYVIWDRRIWSTARAAEGWRQYRHPYGQSSPTLNHEDHVHLSTT